MCTSVQQSNVALFGLFFSAGDECWDVGATGAGVVVGVLLELEARTVYYVVVVGPGGVGDPHERG